MKKVYRLTSVILVVALLSCFMCVSVSAVDDDPSARLVLFYSPDWMSLSSAGDIYGPNIFDVPYPTYNCDFSRSDRATNYLGMGKCVLPLTAVENTIIVSLSYCMYNFYDPNSDGSYVHSLPPDECEAPYVTWLNSIGSTVTGDLGDVIRNFDPQGIEVVHSTGVSVSATFEGTLDDPISNLMVFWDPRVACGYYSNAYPCFHIVSFRVISSAAPSADLTELKNIASQIAQSNEILSAMYGDILAVCNAIYERNGSILEAQQLTHAYFETIIPVLNSISSTTSNIYSLLSQQFSLLISTIESESDDIQSSIDNAVERLIAYFDNVFSSSVNPDLPGQSEDIISGSQTWEDAESGYQSTASERFESISADFSGFDGSVLSGVALGSTLFQRLWNVLGDYVIIYTFPLTLSICLVIVGRASRQSTRSKSSGGRKKDDSGGDTTT